jgi:hypothetical protein
LFANIQSAAAMTSLVIAMPLSSMTSIETIGAVGAAPAYPVLEPAAMPATKVPCPRPSPAEFGWRLVIVTCLTTRPPKSVRPAATPLSTIAIAGTFSDDSACPV